MCVKGGGGREFWLFLLRVRAKRLESEEPQQILERREGT